MKRLLFFSVLSIFCFTASAQNWVQLGNDINGKAPGDDFGRWASLSADGNTVAGGAQYNDDAGNDAGQVRVFSYNGTVWSQKGADIDGEAADDHSSRVSLSADGNTLAVGAPYNDNTGNGSGNVRVFSFDGANWVQLGATIPSETANDQSGGAVSMSADGTRVAIGSIDHRSQGINTGQVRVFGWNGNAWVKLGSNINGEAMEDQFGYSVKLSADGNTFVAGALYADPVSNGNGEISVYEFNGTEWIAKGDDIPGEQTNGNFGLSVDISADGNTIISAESEFKSNSGDRIGRARVFSWNGTSWVQKGSSIDGMGDFDKIGIRVAINNPGNIIAIKGLLGPGGATTLDGNTRIFKFNGTDWVQFGQTIYGQVGDNSGFGLEFSNTGDTISIGFPQSDANGQDSGQVRVYKFDQPLSVIETNQEFGMLYPNPTTGNFTIDLGKEHANVTVQIYNILGQQISSEKYASAKIISKEITGSIGVYFVRISTVNEGSKTLRIIKE
ncbi:MULTISPECIES: T9SS type A sorting domain-containing protein [Aequorivita]|uniref:T9SS type A sorting domain-containing protein n=2 Tax=Aequorivita TaxID=153265 RepID=A0AB35YRX8_9FLAO|nr:T9SS type A sorting domain-containing protein [Aequorivita sp. Ant34-E75]WGF93154.1 T9SS type A sorting domain-containing protein [Aequorivita sp. Ant34-E75]